MKNYYEILGIDKNASKDEIKKVYRKLLRKYPPEKEAEKYKEIREAYDTLRDEKSKKSYDAHLLHGDEIKKLERSADIYIEAKQYSAAVKELKKILLLSEEDTVIREKLANVFLEQKDFGNAQKEYEKLSEEYPDNTNYLINLGLIYEKQGETLEAEKYYKKAYESDYTNSTAISDLVSLYIDKNEVDKAISFLEAEVYRDNFLDFDDFFALTKLLKCYIVKNDTYNLDKIIDKIKFIAPPDEDSRAYMGWKLARLGGELFELKLYKFSSKILNLSSNLIPNDKKIKDALKSSRIEESYTELLNDNSIRRALKVPIILYTKGNNFTEFERNNMNQNFLNEIFLSGYHRISEIVAEIQRIYCEYNFLYCERKEVYNKALAEMGRCIDTSKTYYDLDGYNQYGYDRNGYDRDGYNKKGYDRDGYDKEGYNKEGYDRDGYDKKGYDKNNYDRSGEYKYDSEGYKKDGYDKDGYDRNGYDLDGYDKEGYNKEGYDRDGYDKKGYDIDGYDRNSRDRKGLNKDVKNISLFVFSIGLIFIILALVKLI